MSNRALGVVLAACWMICASIGALADESVRIALDWTPNTNHTGIVVAQQLGYFAEEGLSVEIVQPGPTLSIQLAASGQCEFAVSMQEYVTMARAQDIPIVSLAAVFPHNTSGFAAPAELGVLSPAHFENLRYGGWGSDLEAVMIRTVMDLHGGDFDTVEMFNLGMLDFVTAAKRNFADFFWIFYGWQGIHAQLQGLDFIYIPLVELADVLDYYTPVIVASEAMISEDPDLISRFMRALARGYIYAAQHPEAAANMLLSFAPELDAELVRASQIWLSGQSETNLALWGYQETETWERFATWAFENALIEKAIDPLAAFTNRFLPTEE
ncbi:ABC transporter substrate-binding protein [Candidatus Bipolaricaulota bacterium]|nr:ABC transporter substrate-binding protein [Candidatus Bipolaricaulota bacterium]